MLRIEARQDESQEWRLLQPITDQPAKDYP